MKCGLEIQKKDQVKIILQFIKHDLRSFSKNEQHGRS